MAKILLQLLKIFVSFLVILLLTGIRKNTDGRVRKYNALYTAYNGKLIKPEKSPYPFVIKTLFPNYREI